MDTLVLDIGGDIGALVLHAGPELAEREIEISTGPDEPRSHNQVHARTGFGHVAYTAVFPSVPAGEYLVWHGETPAKVTIRGGEVTEHHL